MIHLSPKAPCSCTTSHHGMRRNTSDNWLAPKPITTRNICTIKAQSQSASSFIINHVNPVFVWNLKKAFYIQSLANHVIHATQITETTSLCKIFLYFWIKTDHKLPNGMWLVASMILIVYWCWLKHHDLFLEGGFCKCYLCSDFVWLLPLGRFTGNSIFPMTEY